MQILTPACCLAIASLLLTPIAAQAADKPASYYATLGTNSGPIPNPQRAESSNFLRASNQNILIDAGDAAAWQLSKIGIDVSQVQTVIISHLHFDHTSGLYAVICLRHQALITDPMTIYGPPGIKLVVEALVLTHNALPDDAIPKAGKEIAASYKGPVTFANDLDKF